MEIYGAYTSVSKYILRRICPIIISRLHGRGSVYEVNKTQNQMPHLAQNMQ